MRMPVFAKPRYPALDLLVRHGDSIAVVIALVPVVAGVSAALAGMPLWVALLGLGGGAFSYLLLRSYVEIVRVLVDTLLPR